MTATATEEALKSIYNYNMIFNNIGNTSAEDDLKFNTNLISDFDLQNFDPKRYEYYVNLLKVFNNDYDTLRNLLNKYNSIKGLKVKERKIIREISDYVNKLKDIESNNPPRPQVGGVSGTNYQEGSVGSVGGGDNNELLKIKKDAIELSIKVEKLSSDANAIMIEEKAEKEANATTATTATAATAATKGKKQAKGGTGGDDGSSVDTISVDGTVVPENDEDASINKFINAIDKFKEDIDIFEKKLETEEKGNNENSNVATIFNEKILEFDRAILAYKGNKSVGGLSLINILKGKEALADKNGTPSNIKDSNLKDKKDSLIKNTENLVNEATKMVENTRVAIKDIREKNKGNKDKLYSILEKELLQNNYEKEIKNEAKEEKKAEIAADKKRIKEEDFQNKLLEKGKIRREKLAARKDIATGTTEDNEEEEEEEDDEDTTRVGTPAPAPAQPALALAQPAPALAQPAQPPAPPTLPPTTLPPTTLLAAPALAAPALAQPAPALAQPAPAPALAQPAPALALAQPAQPPAPPTLPPTTLLAVPAANTEAVAKVSNQLLKLIENTFIGGSKQSGGAAGGAGDDFSDDTLKARYLETRPQRYSKIGLDDDLIKQFRNANEANRKGNGAIKTDNKIEQLSNDIDVYNALPSAMRDDENINKEMIQKIKRFEDDPKNPLEELELTFDDRIVFIIATFFIRYITIIMVQWCIDINIIKTFYEGFIYYAVIYIILFWFIVLFINIDNGFDVKYMNFNGFLNSVRTLFYYFYMGTNGVSRLLIHTSLIIILIVIPIILNIKKNTEFKPEGEQDGVKILDFEERKQLSKALSLFTMFIWLFTSIIATKF